MSVSKPREGFAKNPAFYFIQYKAGNGMGYFYYYDKNIEDKTKRNVKIDLSLGFFVLDEDLFSITGYDEPNNETIISNEVRTLDDKLIVKGWKDKKHRVILTGSYNKLKEEVKASKIYTYTKCMYIMLKINGNLCHCALSGVAFAAWLEHIQPNKNYAESWIYHTGLTHGKKGVVEWEAPIFTVGDKLTKEEFDKAIEIDSTVLQPYLEAYLSAGGAKPAGETPADTTQINTSEWRKAKDFNEVQLGTLTRNEIIELSNHLVEDGQEDGELYQYVGQALFDYQQAAKTWGDKQTKEGVRLGDHSVAELQSLFDLYRNKAPLHPSKIYAEIGLEIKKAESKGSHEEFDDDDDVPF